MTPLYIGSTNPYSGKSMISIGIGKKLMAEGLSVGYMKPYGNLPMKVGKEIVDQDAVFIREILETGDPVELASPVVMTHDLFATELAGKVREDLFEKIRYSYDILSKGRDLLIMGGAANLYDGTMFNVSPMKIIKSLQAQVILVDPFLEGACLDCMLTAREMLKDRLLGVVINQVGPNSIEYLEQQIVPYLQSMNINTLGIIPTDKVMNSITVSQINELLNGEIIAASENKDTVVENLSIGAMTVDDALKFFYRKRNKAVITGGDRADIQLAALETSTSCLVLTGQFRPNELILAKANEKGVPVIIVNDDTLATVETLEKAIGKVRIREKLKVDRSAEIVARYINLDAVKAGLGL